MIYYLMGEMELKSKSKDKKHILSYCPENLEVLVEGKKKVFYNGKNLKTAYLIDFVHILIRKYYYTDRDTTNLDSRILREKYGTYYNYYVNWLVDKNIIQLISDYCVGLKSKTYKLPPHTLKSINTIKNSDTILLKKYKRIYTINYLKKMKYRFIKFETMVKIVEHIDRVTIDYTEAENYLNSIKMRDKQYIKNIHSIKCLNHNDIWYTFDNYGRFHSNLTTLKSNVRSNYLKIDNCPTKEIDIINSQPIFLTILMSKNMDKIDHEEYEFFKQLVITGSLYDYVSQHSGKKERKEIKKMIYTVLFGTNHLNKKDNKIFKKLFPSVFKFIRDYKNEQNNYRALAYELQRSESNLLYNDIIEEIINIDPNIPFFTVHDSITVKESDYELVNDIFNKSMKKLFKKL